MKINIIFNKNSINIYQKEIDLKTIQELYEFGNTYIVKSAGNHMVYTNI